MTLRDPRLEELEYLAELEREWNGRTEKHPDDTPRRRLVADLISAGHVNGVDYFSNLSVSAIESGILGFFSEFWTEIDCVISDRF